VRSVSLGIWIGVGSRDETPTQAGAAHYLEHLLFKGTSTRTASSIAEDFDAVGGDLNAFTAKEHTCYYAQVLDADLPLAVRAADLVTEACNTAADLESERTVVLEEIAMRDDEPSDAVHDLFAETMFGDTPLGRSVLGSVASIEGLTRSDVDGWYRERYVMPSIVVTAAGRVEHQQVLDLVTAAFGSRLSGDARPAPLRLGDQAPSRPARPTGLISRRTEQTHLLLGTPSMGRLDERRYAAAVLDTAVGGGMSSRLFQEIREKRGLVYSVGSSLTPLRRLGHLLGLRGVLEEARSRGARADTRGAGPRRRGRARGRRGGPKQGPAQGGPRARARGHRLPDEPAGQERAVLRRVPLDRRGARKARRRVRGPGAGPSPASCSPRRCAWRSWGRTASPTSTGSEPPVMPAGRLAQVRLGRTVFAGVVAVSLVVLFAPAGDVPSAPPGVDKVVHGVLFLALAATGRWAGLRPGVLLPALVAYAAGSEGRAGPERDRPERVGGRLGRRRGRPARRLRALGPVGRSGGALSRSLHPGARPEA
jgi:hypothetical protein